MPKFTIDSKNKLNELFQSMEMKLAFSEDSECADRNVRYFINSIFQGAKIVVDEKGAEIAKQIAPLMKCRCACSGFQLFAPQILANHPFEFLIRNAKTGTIILGGFVKNPSI